MNKYVKTTGKIVLNVLLYAFIAVCLFAVLLSIFSKKDADGAATMFGYQMRFVRSDSMEQSENSVDVSDFKIKDIRTKSLIFVQTVPEDEAEAEKWYSEIEIGDVLTFRYRVPTGQETITHRVTAIEEKEGGYVFTLKGDNKASEDADTLEQIVDTTDTEGFNYVIGKVTGVNYSLGLLVYALRSPVGIICIIIVPCLIIIGFEVVKIVSVLGEDKKKKQKEDAQKKEDEIEELKKQLLLLQQTVNADTGASNAEHTEEETAENGAEKPPQSLPQAGETPQTAPPEAAATENEEK